MQDKLLVDSLGWFPINRIGYFRKIARHMVLIILDFTQDIKQENTHVPFQVFVIQK